MKKTIVILSNFSWDLDLLHRGHELAVAFRDLGQEVYFVERGRTSKNRTENDIHIVTLGALPYFRGYFKLVYKLNDWLLKGKLTKLLAGLDNPTVYVMHPIWAFAVPDGIKVIFDICDDFPLFAKGETWRKQSESQMTHLIDTANQVITTNKFLAEKYKGQNRTEVIGNGINIGEFERAKPILAGSRPKVGFIGGIYEWVDLGLVAAAAKALPEVDFYLVGPTTRDTELDKLASAPNTQYLGSVSRESIPDYFVSLDVAIVPFVSEDKYPRLKSVDSNKIYQHSFFGTPIVTTDYAQSRELNELVMVSKTEAEFIENIKRALKSGKNQKLIDFAKANTWSQKAEKILKSIN